MAPVITELRSKDDLAKLAAGDIVNFGVWGEPALVYPYEGLKDGELFLLSRLSWTGGVENGIWTIFDNADIFTVENGYIHSNPFSKGVISDTAYENYKAQGLNDDQIHEKAYGPIQRTADGLFRHGIGLVLDEFILPKDQQYVMPEKHAEFERALSGAGLFFEKDFK
jgi:hypothetical protein